MPARDAADEDVEELLDVFPMLFRMIRAFEGDVAMFVLNEYGSTLATFLGRADEGS